jgi:hypothetical protein
MTNAKGRIFSEVLQNGAYATLVSFQLNRRPWITWRSCIFRLDTNVSQISANPPKAAFAGMSSAAGRNHEIGTITPQAELRERAGQSGKPRFGLTPVSKRLEGWHVELFWIPNSGVMAHNTEDISYVT